MSTPAPPQHPLQPPGKPGLWFGCVPGSGNIIIQNQFERLQMTAEEAEEFALRCRNRAQRMKNRKKIEKVRGLDYADRNFEMKGNAQQLMKLYMDLTEALKHVTLARSLPQIAVSEIPGDEIAPTFAPSTKIEIKDGIVRSSAKPDRKKQ